MSYYGLRYHRVVITPQKNSEICKIMRKTYKIYILKSHCDIAQELPF